VRGQKWWGQGHIRTKLQTYLGVVCVGVCDVGEGRALLLMVEAVLRVASLETWLLRQHQG
jgi:hypothetical protein